MWLREFSRIHVVTSYNDVIFSFWLCSELIHSLSRPGHTALRGRIAAESRPKISAREADAVGRFEVAIKTRYSRTLPVVTRGKKLTRGWPREKVLRCSKI